MGDAKYMPVLLDFTKPGDYEVREDGSVCNVLSNGRKVPVRVFSNVTYKDRGKVPCVVLKTKDGKYLTTPVDEVVADAIVHSDFKRIVVEHKDGDMFNCRPKNLRIVVRWEHTEKSAVKKSVIQPKAVVDLSDGSVYSSMKEAQNACGLTKYQVQQMVWGKKDACNGHRLRYKS